MGKLVVFEGPDKVGKETQSKLTAKVLSEKGVSVIRVEPTKESHPRGRKMIYSMLDSGAAKRYPNTFQFVQFLNRIYFQLFKLPKLMKAYDLVILDRWALSGYIYGKCEGISEWLNDWMYKRAKRADLVLVFYGNSYKRSTTQDDSYEKDTDLQRRVKDMYFYRGLGEGHVLVKNDVSIDGVNDLVLGRLKEAGLIP